MASKPYEAPGYAGVHTQLLTTGWFASLIGPEGAWPTQMYGRLVTGESFIFTSRGCSTKLTINLPGQDDPIRTYRKNFPWPQASFLPANECLALMQDWISAYRSGR